MKARLTARSHRRRRRAGYTILEVVSASLIISIVMVPTIDILGSSIDTSEQTEVNNALTTLGVGKLEEQLGLAANQFTDATLEGSFGGSYPNTRFYVRRSQTTSEGGIPGHLMAVVVTVYDDRDGDRQLDREEPRFVFAGKVAKFAGLP